MMEENKKIILLVDDDIDYLYQMKITLEHYGYNVKSANSRKEAEELLIDLKPDLAILDLMMEENDSGFILSYKIKNKYPEIPVIIATAVASETGIKFHLDSDNDKKWIKADLYLEKGIRGDQLHREINKLLKI